MLDRTAIEGRSSGPMWLVGLHKQGQVVGALMMRDVLGRYGHHGLGFFWLLGEPLLLTCGVMALWSFAHVTHGADVAVVPFALTGYTLLTLWRHVAQRSSRAVTQNIHVLYHRQIRPLDILVAKGLVEIVGIFSGFVVALIPLTLLGLCPTLRDPLTLIGGYLGLAAFSFGFGLVLTAICEMSEVSHFFIGPLMYITLPITGVFSMVEWLPANMQIFMMWSPLVNSTEMFRSGLFPSDIPTHYDAEYIFLTCSATLVTGLLMANDRVLLRHRG